MLSFLPFEFTELNGAQLHMNDLQYHNELTQRFVLWLRKENLTNRYWNHATQDHLNFSVATR